MSKTMRLTLGQCNPQKGRVPVSPGGIHTRTPFLQCPLGHSITYYCMLEAPGRLDILCDQHMTLPMLGKCFTSLSHCVFWQVVFNFSSLASQLLCDPDNLNLWSSGLSLPWIGDDGLVWFLHFIPSLVTAAHGASVAYDYSPWHRLSPTLSP